MIRRLFLTAVASAAVLPTTVLAGDLTAQGAGDVLDQIIAGLDRYMDPAVGTRVQAVLRAHREEYFRLDTREAFAAAVSRDLLSASGDKHLKVSVQTVDAGRQARITDEQQDLVDRRLAYGLSAARRLPANIGYLKLSYFEQTEPGARMVDAALGLLKDTDALIIDLRENRGGGGASDEALVGHLDRELRPMVRIAWRKDEGGTETMQRLPRKPAGEALYASKPVYLLTSNKTFSAAEGFAYHLKAIGRVTVVGQTTGGGANPSNRPTPLSYGFRIFIPNGKVTHPVTGANWEGVGVAPDVAVPANEALTAAYRLALAAAQPLVSTAKSEAERTAAIADPGAALLADQAL